MSSSKDGIEPPDVLTVDQAAQLLQLHVQVVRKLARDGDLPGRKLGGSWRFSRRQLLAWIERGELPDQ